MDGSPIGVAVGLVYLAIVVGLTWRLMRRRRRYGPALTGTMHDLLNEDRRKAIEIILEEKAEARDLKIRTGTYRTWSHLADAGGRFCSAPDAASDRSLAHQRQRLLNALPLSSSLPAIPPREVCPQSSR